MDDSVCRTSVDGEKDDPRDACQFSRNNKISYFITRDADPKWGRGRFIVHIKQFGNYAMRRAVCLANYAAAFAPFAIRTSSTRFS